MNNIIMDEIYVEYIGDYTPLYASQHASGADLCANINEIYNLEIGHYILIPTGIKISIPFGYEGQIRPRSGLALKHGLTVLNSPGTIDADYRGELKVLLINLGMKPFMIQPGQRIAQLVIAPVSRVTFHKVTQLNTAIRDNGGYGSTGLF